MMLPAFFIHVDVCIAYHLAKFGMRLRQDFSMDITALILLHLKYLIINLGDLLLNREFLHMSLSKQAH